MHRSVPGVAIYFYSLQSVRARLAKIPSLAAPSTPASEKGSALPKLTTEANLLSGACTRVAVGFLLSPLAVLKARFEVCYFLNYVTVIIFIILNVIIERRF
jgi:solute carrier family 25 protein 38